MSFPITNNYLVAAATGSEAQVNSTPQQQPNQQQQPQHIAIAPKSTMSEHCEPSGLRTVPSPATSPSSAQHQPPQPAQPPPPPHITATLPNLPDILGQLRLVPNQPLIKLPAADYPNPFQLPTGATTAAAAPTCPPPSTGNCSPTRALHDQLFGPKCDCTVSGQAPPATTIASTSAASRKSTQHKSNEHSILHPKLFKQKAVADASGGMASGSLAMASRLRNVLRQPQLRLLEQCLQHGLTRSCASLPDQRPESPVQQQHQQVLQQSSKLPNAQANQSPARSATGSNWTLQASRGLSDYPSLVKDCAKLSLSIGSALASSHSTASAEHSSRAFRQIQKPHNHLQPNHLQPIHHHSSGGGGSSGSRLAARLKVGGQQRCSLRRPRSRSEDRVYAGSAAASSSRTVLATTTATAASTCSQQAAGAASSGGGSGSGSSPADCDVTIDELASYFETFVHIPKKMSSMAEMMYI